MDLVTLAGPIGLLLTARTLTDIVRMVRSVLLVAPLSWTRNVKLGFGEVLPSFLSAAGLKMRLPLLMSETWTVVVPVMGKPLSRSVPCSRLAALDVMLTLTNESGFGLSRASLKPKAACVKM